MGFAWRAIRMAVLLASGAVAYASGADATFRVLVTPPPSVPRPLSDIRAEQVKASLDGAAYRVNTVDRDERLATAPVIIVADFENTSPKFHPCIVSELLPLLRKFEARPGVTVLANGPSPEFVHHIEIGSGPGGVNVLLSRYDDEKTRRWCEDVRASRPEVRFEDPSFGARDANQTMWGIIKGWENSNRLVRVFWLAGDFSWFEAADSSTCLSSPDDSSCGPSQRKRLPHENLPSDYVAGLSKAGISLFPLLIPGTVNPDVRDRRRRDPMVPARYMAVVGGGFATNTDESPPGVSLDRAVAVTDQSYTVEISGAASQVSGTLNVVTETPRLNWKRPYVVAPEIAVSEDARKLPFRAARVLLPSKNFAVRYGCDPKCPDPTSSSISLFLPEFVVNASAGNLYTLVEYVEPPSPFKYRKTLHRGTDACLCLPIEDVEDRLEFRLVVYDETTQWLAASTITFRKNK